jgi:hypothetical protein
MASGTHQDRLFDEEIELRWSVAIEEVNSIKFI